MDGYELKVVDQLWQIPKSSFLMCCKGKVQVYLWHVHATGHISWSNLTIALQKLIRLLRFWAEHRKHEPEKSICNVIYLENTPGTSSGIVWEHDGACGRSSHKLNL